MFVERMVIFVASNDGSQGSKDRISDGWSIKESLYLETQMGTLVLVGQKALLWGFLPLVPVGFQVADVPCTKLGMARGTFFFYRYFVGHQPVKGWWNNTLISSNIKRGLETWYAFATFRMICRKHSAAFGLKLKSKDNCSIPKLVFCRFLSCSYF